MARTRPREVRRNRKRYWRRLDSRSVANPSQERPEAAAQEPATGGGEGQGGGS